MPYTKILLVKPGIRKGLGFTQDVIPIGLEYLASSIENIAEKVLLLDMEFEAKPFQYYIDAFQPDLVGFTVSATDHDESLALADLAKKRGALVVMGGYHPTAVPEEMLSHPQVDVVIRGEGESTLRELMQHGSPEGVRGTSYKVGKQVIHNADRPLVEDLNSLPFPARHLRRHKYKNHSNRDGREYDVITASRGCWGACVFCCEPYMNRSCMRFRSPENIMKELEEIYKLHGCRPLHLLATDPHFIGDPKIVDHLCNLLHTRAMDVTFSVMTRPDSVAQNPELIKKMCDNGILSYELGIESPLQEELNSVKKGITLETQRRAVEILRANGANVSGTLVIGLPNQDSEAIKRFPVYAKDIGLMNCAFGIATPFPGTEFYDSLKAKELIFQDDWTKYDEMHSIFKLDALSPEELERLESYCMGRFWTLNTFLDRAAVMQKRAGKKLSFGDFALDVAGKLAFGIDTGDDLRDSSLKDHVSIVLDAMTDAREEENLRKIVMQDVIDASRFLRILGPQVIRLLLKHGDKSVGYLIQTNGKGVDRIQIVDGERTDTTIDIHVDLDRMFDAFDENSRISMLQSVSVSKGKPHIVGAFDLLRLYTALGTELSTTYLTEKLRVVV
jgi:anaerobic magnesium-protoporphyrin IX monomethyl ester cyclase